MSARRAWWRRAAIALAMLVAIAAGARRVAAEDAGAQAAAIALPIAIDRGAIHVRAAAGLDRPARWVADHAGRDLAAIEVDLDGLPRPASIEIRIVDQTSELEAVSPAGRGAPTWAAGVAYPDVGVIALAIRRGGQLHDLDKTLAHELAHVALGAAIPDAPRWLHEGFAWQHAREFDVDRLETLAGMAWFGGVRPLDQLEAGFPAAELPASRAYAESYDFVGFLVERGRWPDAEDDGDPWPFRRFLRALSGGASLDDAAMQAYGASMDDLFAEWKSSLVRRYMLVPASVFASALWVIAAFLLVLGWWKRRRRSKAQLAAWEAEDEAAARRRTHDSRWVFVPPPTAVDEAVLDAHGGVLADAEAETDEDDDRPVPPRWIN